MTSVPPLAERLEALREKHEQGLLISIDFLKELLDLARDLVSTEQASPPIEQEERGKAALTELLEEAKSDATPIMIERVVGDIDAIVRHARFDGWQDTHAGEREIKKASARRYSSTSCTPTPTCSTGPFSRIHPRILLSIIQT